MYFRLVLLPLVVLLLGAAPDARDKGASIPATPARAKGAAAVVAGSYQVDPEHTQVRFGVSYRAISPYYGIIAGATGMLNLDPGNVAAAKVEIEIPVANLLTTSELLTSELKSADWLDAAHFPTIAFQSTKVTQTGPETADIVGNLTIHGVTQPFVLHAKFFGTAVNPVTKRPDVGFTGAGAIKRSTFGLAKNLPMISDVVGLTINAAFEKAG
jgi:polyisoprenoid-binding protein YceI